MLKKKNIAMVMAAATVATSVAPVFALEKDTVTKEELVKIVKEKLAVKYSEKDLGSVYKITLNEKEITTVADLEKELEMAEVKGEEVTVNIVDKGHVENSDGKIVNVVDGKSYKVVKEEKEKALTTATDDVTEKQAVLNKAIDDVTEKQAALTRATNDVTDKEAALESAEEDDKAAAQAALTTAQAAKTEAEEALTTATAAKTAAEEALTKAKKEVTDKEAELAKLNIVKGETVIDFVAREMKKDNKAIDKVTALDKDGKEYEVSIEDGKVKYKDNNDKEITNIKVTLKSKVELLVNGETAKLDLATGLEKDKSEINIDKADEEAAKRVVDFKVAATEGKSTAELPAKNISKLVYNGIKVKTLEFNLSDFDTDYGYTQEGKALLELLGSANVAKDSDGKNTYTTTTVKDGKKYQVKFVAADDLKLESVKEAGYKLTISLKVAEVGKNLPEESANVKLVIKSNVQKDLADFVDAIKLANGSEVSAGKYEKLAGDSRFDTAVKISEAGFKGLNEASDKEAADSIVLVGENAVVDGLASAPLAKQNKAPILLTKKDSVPTETMKEIKRLVAKGKTIYLIGGENTISKQVESQLIKEMNAHIVRLSGNDRYETSLEIAKKINNQTDTTKEAYVVGGNGLADAMSIAAVAADQGAPIVVTPKDGLTRDAKEFLKDTNKGFTHVDVIGGVNNISIQVLKDIKESEADLKMERIAGADRNDTNAKVIAKYAADLKNVYVAKDGDAQLVDALAAAPLAGNGTNKGVIVLATKDLTKAQADVLKDKQAKQDVTQIGEGIASTVMQKVLKAVGK